jgi:prevent-host-death family protein
MQPLKLVICQLCGSEHILNWRLAVKEDSALKNQLICVRIKVAIVKLLKPQKNTNTSLFLYPHNRNLTMVIDHDMFAVLSGMIEGVEPMETTEVMSISQFKATCLAVLDRVKRTGKPVLVTRRGIPIALIEPPPPPEVKESWLGAFKSKGKITGDIVSPALNEAEWGVLNE